MSKYEVKNVSCAYCGDKYEIKMESDKFNIWIRDDIPLENLFPKMPLNVQLLLIKGVCVECHYGSKESFTGSLCDE